MGSLHLFPCCAATILIILAAAVHSAEGGLLNTFSITGYSAQWAAYNGYASNLLPTNNPNADTSLFWNSGADWNNYPQPYWVSFDLGSSVQVTAFEYKATGDTTHDPKSFDLQTSSSGSGPWTTVQSFTGAAGTTNMQVFTLATPTIARYWKFNIVNTYSQYQAWVPYVNFFVGCTAWNGSTLSSGTQVQIFNPDTSLWLTSAALPVGANPIGLIMKPAATTFTLNGISAFTYPNPSGYQAVLNDPAGYSYDNDWSGNFITRNDQGTAHSWNIGWTTTGKVAPDLNLYVSQKTAVWGWRVGIVNVNSQWIPRLDTAPSTYYNFRLFVCN